MTLKTEKINEIRSWFFDITSLAVQWLRLHASTPGGTGSTPGQGTKILHAAWPKRKIKVGSLKRSIKLINFQPEKREMTKITDIRNERRAITTYPMYIQRIIKKYYLSLQI